MRHRPSISRCAAFATLALAATAHADASSELSQASAFAVGVSIAVPVLVVAGAGTLVVSGVEASGEGVRWVVENVADGSRATIRFSGQAGGVSAVAVGTVITATAIGAGVVLSVAGRVIAFIPNEIGKTLLYNRRVSR